MSRGLWLTPEIVTVIKRRSGAGESRKAIADDLHIHPTVVGRIALGKRRTPGISCICGYCERCFNRVYAARYRQRKKALTRDARAA